MERWESSQNYIEPKTDIQTKPKLKAGRFPTEKPQKGAPQYTGLQVTISNGLPKETVTMKGAQCSQKRYLRKKTIIKV